METEITVESLATVVGAVPATAMVLQFVKIFWKGGSNATMRQLSAAIAAILVVVATFVINDEVTWELGIAGLFAGITAGLAASQSYEVVKDGIDHQTMSGGEGGHP